MVSQVTLETGDVKPLTEFIIFTTLPTEVQLKIWKHCVSLQPRIVGQTWGTCDAVACDGNEQVILRQVSHTTREETLKSLGYSAITLTGPYFDQTDPYPKFLFNPDIDLFFMDGELIQDGTVKDARCIAMIDWMFNDKAMSFLQQFDSLDLIFIVCEEVKVAQLSKDGSDKRRVIFQVLEGRPTWELGNVAPEKMKALIARGPNKKTIPQVECVKLIREKPSMKGLKGFEQFVGQGRIMDDLMLAMTRSLQGMA